jgi:CRISPR-associated protein Cas6
MYWQEEQQRPQKPKVRDDIVDVVYAIDGRTLPIDHAGALSEALHAALPWLGDEARAGIHLIHVAESGNGWYRPQDSDNEVLHISRRTKMTLRLPKERLSDAEVLTGTQLDIDGHPLTVGKTSVKTLSSSSILFARYVMSAEDESEEEFLHQAAAELQELDIAVKKMMSGKSHVLKAPPGRVFTRSLMVADLELEEAVRLQEHGLGEGRKFGCGLFIPHKGIKAVNEQAEQS